ncbi:hypothetical protein Areg01_30140 [Actinoplanes regularis]|nr:hypothetical protein Areg01_30140 [Actinoplanes regularis]
MEPLTEVDHVFVPAPMAAASGHGRPIGHIAVVDTNVVRGIFAAHQVLSGSSRNSGPAIVAAT